ncbi:DUF6912 family protein [Saccharomonospora iraqiensis]|uniref:DUF6912 family protein n=1 Tax=Saccharomonospora iraqiensis TaxID=52698 RepID=UPI000491BA4F|nr:hypothetical protein [Saccharomonospora iraqiensis]
MRVYVPATVRMLRELVDHGEVLPVNGTAFALTPALRESYTSGTTEELEYAALTEAARASLRLLAAERDSDGADADGGDSDGADAADGDADGVPSDPDRATGGKHPPRRVVISADPEEVTLRPDLDHAVVRLSGPVPLDTVAAVHVDTPDAESAVLAAAPVIDDADLGDEDAELALGDAEDHELAWYAPQELPFLLELM